MRWPWTRPEPPVLPPDENGVAGRLDRQRRLWPEILRMARWAATAAEENRFSAKIAEAYRSER